MRLEAKQIGARLQSKQLLENVSVHLEAGELVGLVGPNGAGKTSLIRALANLLTLSAGAVSLNGINISRIERRELALQISYLPQESQSHWPLKVRAVVELGRLPHRRAFSRPLETDADIVDRTMAITNVSGLADRSITELSGGERQRVLLGRTLAVEAPFVLVDEPLAAFDPRHQLSIMEILRSVARKGKCVLIALHDLSLAARFCDRLIMIADGRIVQTGHPDKVLNRSVLSEVYGVDVICGKTEGISFFLPKAANS